MEFSTRSGRPEALKAQCLLVFAEAGGKLGAAARALDAKHGGVIAAAIKRGDLTGKSAQVLALADGAVRIVVVGLGKVAEANETGWLKAMRAGLDAVLASAAHDLTVCLDGHPVRRRDAGWYASQIAQMALHATQRPDQMKSKREDPPKLAKISVWAESEADQARIARGLRHGQAIGEGATLARELGNLPANVCTPSYLADRAEALGKEAGLKVQVFDEKAIAKMDMGSFLSVARGSAEPPRFIVLRYQGAAKDDPPVALVGKGVTFDTGGISIKPSGEMDEMKYDMCGAASVFGTLHAVAQLKLPINVVGIIPATENMPGGKATKPGDIVTSMSGQTIEILNTDAEGRLILCDALTYAKEKVKPVLAIDIATLTGACVIALGHVASGLYSNDDKLAKELLDAGHAAWDRAWHMPLWDDYQQQLSSNFADMGNIGGRPGGSITAACFLSRFTRDMKWAHLDIAGTAWVSGKAKGATGRPVGLLTEFLISRSGGDRDAA
ncbi:MAG: leucyl aminopeptidase [Rhodocyclaceae bacterium]|nr:leucyl aminopeptidase [Rhodocyclaceae bacterium]